MVGLFRRIQIDVESAGDSAQATAERLLNFLGWRVAQEDKKRQALARRFVALGVVLNFAETEVGKLVAASKGSRVVHVCAVIDEILERGA